MAIVRKITRGADRQTAHPTEVDAVVRMVRLTGGGVFVQFDTFGSDGRESEKKVSQTLQFDRQSAQILRRVIDEAFGSDE